MRNNEEQENYRSGIAAPYRHLNCVNASLSELSLSLCAENDAYLKGNRDSQNNSRTLLVLFFITLWQRVPVPGIKNPINWYDAITIIHSKHPMMQIMEVVSSRYPESCTNF